LTLGVSWLPVEVAAREPVRAAIKAALLQWSAAWFTSQSLDLTRLRAYRPNETPDEGRWLRFGCSIALSIAPSSLERLASWALDAPLDLLELTPNDQTVITNLQQAMLSDLSTQLEEALGIEERPPRDKPELTDRPLGGLGGVTASISATGMSAKIAVPLQAIVPFCQKQLPTPRRKALRPVRREVAVGSAKVRLRAELGGADITMADLRRLSPGDVVVLDRLLEDGPAIVAKGMAEPIAGAQMSEGERGMILTLQSDGA